MIRVVSLRSTLRATAPLPSLNRVEDVQEEWRRGRTKECDFKQGVKSKGFRAGQDTSLPEARSRRRDDGSGQAANMADGTDHAHPRLADLSSSNPIRWRPRADPGQKHDPGGTDHSQVERRLDNPRPVTEAHVSLIGRIEQLEMADFIGFAA